MNLTYPSNMLHLYVLKLEGGMYYVGITTDLKKRIKRHKQSGGCKWTRLYRYVDTVETRSNVKEEDENAVTLQYMKKYGWKRVRGGSYSRVDLKNPPKEVGQNMSEDELIEIDSYKEKMLEERANIKSGIVDDFLSLVGDL